MEIVYWLVDTRPNGRPFYCGRTARPLRETLQGHVVAARKAPARPASRLLLAGHVRIVPMAFGADVARWRRVLRLFGAGRRKQVDREKRRKINRKRTKCLEQLAQRRRDKEMWDAQK